MDISEPAITKEEVLILPDPDFHAGNVCIVTGAANGIGRGTAVAAAANGLMTVGLDINQAEGRKTQQIARDLGGQMVFIQCDLTSDREIEAAVAEAAKLGTIKYLASIAGLQHVDAIENFPMEKYDLMTRLMLRAPFYMAKLCIPHMQKSPDGRGAIGNMSSVHGHMCTLNKSVYNITKFGLRALAQSISAEGQGRIRSFTVSTGFVRTPLALGQIPAQAQQRGISQQDVVEQVMMGKSRIKTMMKPIEVANLFIFGLSDHGRYLIGGDLLFDGGMVLTY